MNRDELITIKYTKTDDGCAIVPHIRHVTVEFALKELEAIIQQPNDYAIRFDGELITSLNITDFVLIANGENGTGYRMQSVEKFTEFLHELNVTKLLRNPDSDLMSMYPISLEMWL